MSEIAAVLDLLERDHLPVIGLLKGSDNPRDTGAKLRKATCEPLYAIPVELLETLSAQIPEWFTDDEMQCEVRLSQTCKKQRAIAIFLGRFVQHRFLMGLQNTLSPPTSSVLDEDLFARMQTAMELFTKETLPLQERQEAFIGWLVTNRTYLAEREALRTRWTAVVEVMGGIPRFPAAFRLDLFEPTDLNDARQITLDLNAFYDRWELSSLSTWYLPEPKGYNVGCPSICSELAGIEERPAVQMPASLRLPARFQLEDYLQDPVEDHLEEWQAIMEQRHPSKLGYDSWRRVLHLHFWRDIVLASRYQHQFRRRTEALDRVFGEFLHTSEESIRKHRQFINRRLQSET